RAASMKTGSLPDPDPQNTQIFMAGTEECSELEVVLVVAHLLVGYEPNRNDGENEEQDDDTKNFHCSEFAAKVRDFPRRRRPAYGD
ncbi:MAG: hypothetical protein ACKOAR_12820, partial [Bacteroidota bacterium]